jgi:hypothetical protein
MPKPASLMIAIGLPHGGEGPDEDSLNREQDGNGDDGDLATEAVMNIVRNLQEGKASAVRELRAFTAALEALCDAFMDRDYHAVGEAASDARDVLHVMLKK